MICMYFIRRLFSHKSESSWCKTSDEWRIGCKKGPKTSQGKMPFSHTTLQIRRKKSNNDAKYDGFVFVENSFFR